MLGFTVLRLARWSALMAAGVLLAPPLAAQGTLVRLGSIVRWTDPASGRRIQGTVVGMAPESLVVDGCCARGSPGRYTLSPDLPLDKMVLGHGHAWQGAAIGLFGGAVVGGIVGAASIDADWRTVGAILGVGIGAVGGTVLGLIVGSTSRTHTWVPARTRGNATAVAPVISWRGGPVIGVQVTF